MPKRSLRGEQEPLTLTIPEAGALANLGRNASYAAAKRGQIPTITLDRKLRVPGELWRRILRGEAPRHRSPPAISLGMNENAAG